MSQVHTRARPRGACACAQIPSKSMCACALPAPFISREPHRGARKAEGETSRRQRVVAPRSRLVVTFRSTLGHRHIFFFAFNGECLFLVGHFLTRLDSTLIRLRRLPPAPPPPQRSYSCKLFHLYTKRLVCITSYS